MTQAVSRQDRAAAAVDLDLLAGEVAAAVTGPRGPEPERDAVRQALRRRADGETYAAIAAAIGVSEKRAAAWCREAARIDPAFDAREAKPRRKRDHSRRVGTKMLTARIEAGLLDLVTKRAGDEGRSTTAVVEAALKSYVGRKVAGLETAVRRELRKRLKEELRELAAAIGAHDAELSRQGSNLNQLTAFVNKYKELPVSIVDELAATRRALDENREATERLHETVLARFEEER